MGRRAVHKCSYVHLDICAAGWGWLRAAEEGAMARLAGLRARPGGLMALKVVKMVCLPLLMPDVWGVACLS